MTNYTLIHIIILLRSNLGKSTQLKALMIVIYGFRIRMKTPTAEQNMTPHIIITLNFTANPLSDSTGGVYGFSGNDKCSA